MYPINWSIVKVINDRWRALDFKMLSGCVDDTFFNRLVNQSVTIDLIKSSKFSEKDNYP